jgi:uncharacterized membrane protein YccC
VLALLAAALCFALVFPPDAAWLIDKTQRELRAQITRACEDRLDGLNHRFHASTHDLMFQLRGLLANKSRQHRRALRWMLATLEVGQAVIDMREAAARVPLREHPRLRTEIQTFWIALSKLFAVATVEHRARALDVSMTALEAAQRRIQSSLADTHPREMRRMVASLHFIRTALLDRDAPFHRR